MKMQQIDSNPGHDRCWECGQRLGKRVIIEDEKYFHAHVCYARYRKYKERKEFEDPNFTESQANDQYANMLLMEEDMRDGFIKGED